MLEKKLALVGEVNEQPEFFFIIQKKGIPRAKQTFRFGCLATKICYDQRLVMLLMLVLFLIWCYHSSGLKRNSCQQRYKKFEKKHKSKLSVSLQLKEKNFFFPKRKKKNTVFTGFKSKSRIQLKIERVTLLWADLFSGVVCWPRSSLSLISACCTRGSLKKTLS